MKLTESHLRNLIKQELKRFLNISESQDNKPRRYSPQEMQAIEDQIMRDEEDELEGRPLDPRSGPFPDPKSFPRRTAREMQAIEDQIMSDEEDELEGRPPNPRSGPIPDPKKYPRRTPQEIQAIYDQIITNWEEDDEEELEEKIKSQSVRSLKEKLARFARK